MGLNLGLGMSLVRHSGSGLLKYSLSGTITTSGNQLEGVTVDAGAIGSTTTNASGQFSFSNIAPDTSYTLTPSLTGYTFSPTSLTGTLSTNVSNANFTATVAAFTPTDIASLAGWWDTSDSCYTTGNVALATNGQAVTQLRDKSGAARHLTASTTPSYVAAGINSKGVLQFNSSATIQSSNNFVYDVHHLFLVVKGSGSDVDLVGSDNLNSGDILLQVDGSRKGKAHIWTSGGANAAIHGTTINDNDILILEQIVDATNVKVAINGGTPVTTALSGTKGGTTRPIVLGSRYANAGGNKFAGQLGECILVTVTLPTSQQRADCIAYLKAKWGIA